MEIFKDIKSVDRATVSESEGSAWLFPEKRKDSAKLSSFGRKEQSEQISRYFYKVYDRTDEIKDAEEAQYTQFTVTYGNRQGGGAPSFPSETPEPTKAIYEQYASSLLEEGTKSFGFRKDHFYALNLSGRVLENGMIPESFELTLSIGDSKITLVLGEGSKIYRKNPVFVNQEQGTFIQPGGSLEKSDIDKEDQKVRAPNVFAAFGVPSVDGVSETGGRIYGFLYPQKGVVILDPDMIAEEVSKKEKIVPESRTSSEILNQQGIGATFLHPGDAIEARKLKRKREGFGYEGGLSGDEEKAEEIFPDWPYVRNHEKFFQAVKRGGNFKLKVKRKEVKSTFEIEIGEEEFNHSTNPTYATKSGNVTFPGDSPYFTTVGLYSDEYELLAVAKLESPVKKEESTVSIEVDF